MSDQWEQILAEQPFFKDVPDGIMKVALQGAVPITVKRGRCVACQGDSAESLILVLEGLIKVSRVFPDGREILIRMMQEGDAILTDMGIPEACAYEENFEAVKPTKVIFIKKAHYLTCMDEHPDLSHALLSAVNRQAQCLADEITLVKWQYLPQRVASFLVGLCNGQQGEVQLRLPYEKTLLAARLGASRESLSRSFADLRRIGVDVRHMDIFIADRATLSDYAETSSHDMRTRCERK